MAGDYIPSRDSELDDWLLNFKSLIVANPTTYGLVTADGTALNNSYNLWHDAFITATNPTTRTKATVATKNEQKALVLGVFRGYAATIRVNKAVTDELKIGLGLHIADTSPTPVPVPSTYPVLTISGMGQGLQDLRAADQATPSKRAKPAGAAGLLLFRAVGTAPVSEPGAATFLSFVSKAAYRSTFTSADNGKVATYFARWTNAKGEVGPWSPPASMPIAA